MDCNFILEPLKLIMDPLQILLYMMVAMEEIRPALEPNIEQLEEDFESLQGNVKGTGGCMYVFVCNGLGEQQFVTYEIQSQWDLRCTKLNNIIERHILQMDSLKRIPICVCYVFCWDGNYKNYAWSQITSRCYAYDMDKHACPKTYVVQSEEQEAIVSQAFNEMNMFIVQLHFIIHGVICPHLVCAHNCFGSVHRDGK